jgi:hypothetical protein
MCKEFELELSNNQFVTYRTYQDAYSAAGKWESRREIVAFWMKKTEIWDAFPKQTNQKMHKMDWLRYLSSQGSSERDLVLRE